MPVLAVAIVCLLALASCTTTRTVTRVVRVSAGGAPPAPPTSLVSPRPGQPPTVWIAGTLSAVGPQRIEVREGSGPTVTVQRLAEGATGFFEVRGGAWALLPRAAAVPPGGAACVEALMAGPALLALRVFLGAGCGPS